MGCTATLQAVTRREEWQSSHLTLVRISALNFDLLLITIAEMLTPIDQPIDKLEDLDQMEM
jgi:hypothetical protein